MTSVQSVQGGIYALGKAHVRSTLSLGRFPIPATTFVVRMRNGRASSARRTLELFQMQTLTFGTVPMSVWPTMALSRPFKEDRRALSLAFHSSLLHVVDDVMCPLTLCAQVVYLNPQLFRASETRAGAHCGGCFAHGLVLDSLVVLTLKPAT